MLVLKEKFGIIDSFRNGSPITFAKYSFFLVVVIFVRVVYILLERFDDFIEFFVCITIKVVMTVRAHQIYLVITKSDTKISIICIFVISHSRILKEWKSFIIS